MKIIDYFFKPAEWWQFWQPQSGVIGGAIFGTIIGITMGLIIDILRLV